MKKYLVILAIVGASLMIGGCQSCGPCGCGGKKCSEMQKKECAKAGKCASSDKKTKCGCGGKMCADKTETKAAAK